MSGVPGLGRGQRGGLDAPRLVPLIYSIEHRGVCVGLQRLSRTEYYADVNREPRRANERRPRNCKHQCGHAAAVVQRPPEFGRD